jgi:hypothetical protein
MNLQEKIDKLIPYVSENFITYPLWEDGKYIPHLNFWQICKNGGELENLFERLNKFDPSSGYIIWIVEENIMEGKSFELQIYPNYDDIESGGYTFIKKDWSIEEMVEIVGKIIKK